MASLRGHLKGNRGDGRYSREADRRESFLFDSVSVPIVRGFNDTLTGNLKV